MKNIITVLTLLISSIVSANAQVITFKIDTFTCFEHSSTITTDMAIRTNSYTITGESYPNAVYSFDLDSMILHYTDKNGLNSNCTIIEKEIFNDSLKTFKAIFITSKTHQYIEVILSTGVDEKDGYVVYFRTNERTNGVTTTKGAFETNVLVK